MGENWEGAGFTKMINGWKAKYGPVPVVEGDFDYYKITFPTEKISGSTTTNTTTKNIAGTTTKIVGEAKEKEVLEIIRNNPMLSVAQIAPILGLSRDGVRYHIRNLKKRGILRRKGHGRGGSWEVLKR